MDQFSLRKDARISLQGLTLNGSRSENTATLCYNGKLLFIPDEFKIIVVLISMEKFKPEQTDK